MDTFQIVVLVVATVILILIFASIGILTKYSYVDDIYPPTSNTCPDFWTVDSTGNCIIPETNGSNVGNIYSSTGSSVLTNDNTETSKVYTPGYVSAESKINFNDPAWSSIGTSGICAKKKWTNTNDVLWDGVSNYNSCE